MLDAIFAQIFREFLKVLRAFARILRDFSWIFTKLKPLGVRLHPFTSASYTSAVISSLKIDFS